MGQMLGYAAKLGFVAESSGDIDTLAFSAGSDLDATNRTGWYADIATSGSEKYGIVVGGAETVNAQGSTLSTGRLAVLYTTPSTSTTTGALVVGGGVGIGGRVTCESISSPKGVETSQGFGAGALSSNTTGDDNTASGYQALFSNTTGDYNTAIGYQALYSNTEGDDNTASGGFALYSNTIGNNNTASGFAALYSNTTGIRNTGSGHFALFSNTEGDNNTASGYFALYSNTIGNNNTASGHSALYGNTTGVRNTASGYQALFSNTEGDNNTASGYQALYSNTTGTNNTASGLGALFSNTTGSYNTASGRGALLSNTTGSYNTASGYDAGRYTNAGSAATDIVNCVLLGHDTRVEGASDTNEIVIGAEAKGNGSNTTTLGNIDTAMTYLPGGSLALVSDSWTYYGSPSANGSWRFGRDGDNTVFQRRESDTWVTKMTVEA